MRYFKNSVGECFISSLANLLLLKFQDEEIARKIITWEIYEGIIKPNGATALGTWPYVVDQLTQSKYIGTLFTTEEIMKEAGESVKREFSSVDFDLYRRIVDEERTAGRIITGKKYDGPSPVILGIGDPCFGGRGHAVVAIGDYYYEKDFEVSFIDNGEESVLAGNYDPHFLPRIMYGLLNVERVQSSESRDLRV